MTHRNGATIQTTSNASAARTCQGIAPEHTPSHVVHRLPHWAPMGGITLGRHVFVKSPSLIDHELVHVRQQAEDGWRFFLRYVFSPSWRVRYEAEAYADDVRRGWTTVPQAASNLSSWLYLKPCSYAEAVLAIREVLS